ncbi:hypothetical protein [Gracilimonas mengyeensis]|uniref:Uncharacterized protein n=1 Tax=Gracilimonas mengyeensis TaxID=1302730 RepID=A0A521BNP0_9BACT|nr:hypothetical protein [Gracilimonas mengyeensis]SMO48371.1 hypothetical protein SAMN06265219_102401 [Gracilimonas mengyeensis]
MKNTFDYCLRENLLGVGWRVPGLQSTKNWNDYYKEAIKTHGKVNVCKYINKWVEEYDLVWTRDQNGKYYLAKVESGWEYLNTKEAKDKDIDIANVFRCENILPVEIDEVPGKVIASFRAKRSIQKVTGFQTLEYSKFLWNKLSGKDTYDINSTKIKDVFSMLDDEETEDLIFLYLQTKDWFIVPNSRKGDTMKYEFYLISKIDHSKALVQVKTGNSILNREEYLDLDNQHLVYLFQSNEKYVGKQSNNIVCLSRDEIRSFIEESFPILPKAIKFKYNLVKSIKG